MKKLHNKQLQRRLQRLETLQKTYGLQLQKLFTWRLGLGLLIFATLLFLSALNSPLIMGALLIEVIGFATLVKRTSNVRRFIRHLQQLSIFTARQLHKLQGSYACAKPYHSKNLDADSEALNSDLNLFGTHSVFTLISEAFSPYGKEKLASWLTDPSHDKQRTIDRQLAVKELSTVRWPLTRWNLLGQQMFSNEESVENITLDSMQNTHFLMDKDKKFVPLLTFLCIVAWGSAILASLGTLSINPATPIVLFAVISLGSVQKTSENFSKAQNLATLIKRYLPLFQFIETNAPRHDKLKSFASSILAKKPSRSLRRIDFLITLLSVRGHALAHLGVNMLFPWDFLTSYFLQRWHDEHKQHFPEWIEELSNLEALSSLFFVYHYQTQTFPVIKDLSSSDSSSLKIEAAIHPLIDRSKVIGNDFEFSDPVRLALLTGSNMSGKSTFLRTIGINQCLALMGAPVFAKSFTTTASPVITCLRISDSVDEGVSSFYYEVRRVKSIIEKARSGESFIYLIDEIFRGTNNRERLQGSRAVIDELLKLSSPLGFISTHDLELAKLANDHPQLNNWHFRDEINEAEGGLHFTYQIQSGPCPTTNALRIMASEGLPVSI